MGLNRPFGVHRGPVRSTAQLGRQPGTPIAEAPSARKIRIPRHFRARGRVRLETRNCDLPPLRLNIRRSEAGGTVFENQDKLKLVGV